MRAGPLRRRSALPGLIATLLMLSPVALATATAPQTATSSIARVAAPPQAPEFSGCGGINQPVVNADYEQQVVDLVNLERANRGLPPYKRVTALDEAARYHSADLGQDNYWSHDTYDRSGGSWSTSATRGRASARIIPAHRVKTSPPDIRRRKM